MAYGFHKDKLPRGYSYPLKRSALDAQLEKEGITQVASVNYVFSRDSDGVILRVYFTGETYHGVGAGKSSIWLWAVPSERKQLTEQVMLEQALPTLWNWLVAAEKAGNTWRAKSRHLDFSLLGERLVVTEY